MKLVTWNCCGAFRDEKAERIFALDPDIAIIQECSEIDTKKNADSTYASLWFGNPLKKGVAVFHKRNWAMHPVGSPSHKWVAAFDVEGPEKFTLIAVWSCPEGSAPQRYVKLIRDAISKSPHWFNNGLAVVAGDFNSNCQWDRPRDRHHGSLVEDLAGLGMISAYHASTSETQGAESKKTFYQYRHIGKPYHIDYVFVPEIWASRIDSVEVGVPSDWLSLSDHCPIAVNIAP